MELQANIEGLRGSCSTSGDAGRRALPDDTSFRRHSFVMSMEIQSNNLINRQFFITQDSNPDLIHVIAHAMNFGRFVLGGLGCDHGMDRALLMAIREPAVGAAQGSLDHNPRKTTLNGDQGRTNGQSQIVLINSADQTPRGPDNRGHSHRDQSQLRHHMAQDTGRLTPSLFGHHKSGIGAGECSVYGAILDPECRHCGQFIADDHEAPHAGRLHRDPGTGQMRKEQQEIRF